MLHPRLERLAPQVKARIVDAAEAELAAHRHADTFRRLVAP